MLLKTGQNIYELPEPLERNFTRLYLYKEGDPKEYPKQDIFTALHVSAAEVEGPLVEGLPTYYAIFGASDAKPKLKVRPTPDRDYFARFTYCPKEKVL